ncbi:PAS domain-containing protein [Rhizobium laguerreae]|uniref:PAS domain-containing protein n=1 Tax=Rhizobium laguerreae TaxID=1076926 RepID=UPI001C900AB5|nr:PAS domain-containing protein [Rhizobium laguerreae]MBY3035282.1 PAS domain-containing protein [Rhizobium laguerreae]MBY3054117.1 PAS domain-containing protein [Rhizobium laguerreae]MBY3334160.1 PAS domain-containing protein [Rhizobium laguerreae]
MPLHFEQPVIDKTEQSRAHIGITDAEVVQMLAAYRLFGFWRIDIETGHFFASEDVHAIFGLSYSDGPVNLTELMSRIHEEDRSLIAQTFEETSRHGVGFHFVYRVDNRLGGYKLVRSVGRFRNDESGGGIVGITYEFVEKLRVVGFEDNTIPR